MYMEFYYFINLWIKLLLNFYDFTNLLIMILEN